jgi:hypothetical protein
MRFTEELTFDEWKALAASIGRAARSVAFVVGDWLVYGQNLFGTDGFPDRRVPSELYAIAAEATGMDTATLQNYAYVSRSVPYPLRSELLSWEHHRLLAKLPEGEIPGWIDACLAERKAGRGMSTRRLRRSLNLGRVATDADLEPGEGDRGIENHIPFVNRLAGWWRRMREARFLETATPEQRAALKRDLEPVVEIYRSL